MNLNDTKLDKFMNQIELMKRNKINDYSFVDQFHYVDPNGYISKLDIPVDHVIFGKRGSGKTTLMQKSISNHKKLNTCVVIDCESNKRNSETNILIAILKQIIILISNETDVSGKIK